jgi:hypothetical protein
MVSAGITVVALVETILPQAPAKPVAKAQSASSGPALAPSRIWLANNQE